MKEWIVPTITELDIRLTEKVPGTSEQMARPGLGGWQSATYPANASADERQEFPFFSDRKQSAPS